MPDEIVIDRVGTASQQGIVNLDILCAGHAKNGSHTLRFQTFNENISAFHVLFLLSGTGGFFETRRFRLPIETRRSLLPVQVREVSPTGVF